MSQIEKRDQSISGELIDIGEAAALLETSTQVKHISKGTLSIHWLEKQGDESVLVQANGEFALLR